jgi:hypothetical protein
MKGKYKITLKKEVFIKFFNILKIPGSAFAKIDDKEMLELEYSIDKCAFIKVILETPCRSI